MKAPLLKVPIRLLLVALLPATSALSGIPEYRFGESRAELVEKEGQIRAAAGDPAVRRELAREMALILAGPASLEAKRFACRQLSLIGEEDEVPVLAGLLPDGELSDMARFALERNPAPEARAALRAALPILKGHLQIGVINSLGNLRDSGATEELAKILSASDEDARLAAAAALGRIGGERAATALKAARPEASGQLVLIIDDAYLSCADHLLARGDGAAAGLYREILDRPGPGQVRAAAMRGLANLEGPNILPLLLDTLGGDGPDLKTAALRCLSEIDLAGKSEALQRALGSLTPEIRALSLGALAARADSLGRQAARAAIQDENAPVRLAALKALGSLGDADCAPLLAAAAARDQGEEREAARAALDSLPATGTNAVLLALVRTEGPTVRKEIIRSLAARNATESLPVLIKALADSDDAIRAESAAALGKLELSEGLGPLISALLETKSGPLRSAARESIQTICRNEEFAEDCSRQLVSALEPAEIPARCDLLVTLPTVGGEFALKAVRRYLQDGSTIVQESAIRALGKWTDATPADDLLLIARNNEDERIRIMALRGYIRLTGLASDRPDAETAGMFSTAFDAAFRLEEKRMILAALGERPKPYSLDLLVPRLYDPNLQNEAVAGIQSVCRILQYSDPEICKDALKRAAKTERKAEKKMEIRASLKALKAHFKYLALWRICGPYQEPSIDRERLLEHEFGPERGEDADWWEYRPDDDSERPWRIDLAEEIGDEDAVAYLQTWIWSPEPRPARLELGSDDGIKAWLNGKLVHEKNVTRNLIDRQDRIKVNLLQGWNQLMLKVSQGSGEWGVSARICRSLGRRIPGMKISPRPKDHRE